MGKGKEPVWPSQYFRLAYGDVATYNFPWVSACLMVRPQYKICFLFIRLFINRREESILNTEKAAPHQVVGRARCFIGFYFK